MQRGSYSVGLGGDVPESLIRQRLEEAVRYVKLWLVENASVSRGWLRLYLGRIGGLSIVAG